jgi:ABC-type antimicrobial peptide transport system permease subunit
MSAEMDAMDRRRHSPSIVLRRLAGAVVAVAMIVASLTTFARSPSLNGAPGERVSVPLARADLLQAAFGISKASKATIAKLCQKAVLPGTVNACSAGSGITGMPVTESAGVMPQFVIHQLHWRMADDRLGAQCGGAPPDRPPCPTSA